MLKFLSNLFNRIEHGPSVQTMTYGQFNKLVHTLDRILDEGMVCTMHVSMSGRSGCGGILQKGGGHYIPMKFSCFNGRITVSIKGIRRGFDIQNLQEVAKFLEQEMIAMK